MFPFLVTVSKLILNLFLCFHETLYHFPIVTDCFQQEADPTSGAEKWPTRREGQHYGNKMFVFGLQRFT